MNEQNLYFQSILYSLILSACEDYVMFPHYRPMAIHFVYLPSKNQYDIYVLSSKAYQQVSKVIQKGWLISLHSTYSGCPTGSNIDWQTWQSIFGGLNRHPPDTSSNLFMFICSHIQSAMVRSLEKDEQCKLITKTSDLFAVVVFCLQNSNLRSP